MSISTSPPPESPEPEPQEKDEGSGISPPEAETTSDDQIPDAEPEIEVLPPEIAKALEADGIAPGAAMILSRMIGRPQKRDE